MRVLIVVVSLAVISLQACRFDSVEELYPKPPGCDTTVTTYMAVVSKIINTNCGVPGCHRGAAVRQGIGDFDTHEGLKIYLDNNRQRFLGALNHEQGFSPMPKGGARLDDCDIQKIERWIDRGYKNN